MFKNIQLLPFPCGKDFAVSFVDDTDMSTRENTEPVYDLLSSLNIKGTKTVWVNRQKRASSFRRDDEKEIDFDINSGSTLEDKEYLEFVLNLKSNGFEIALHNVAAGNSFREEIIEGVEKFRAIFGEYPKINVFHERNIENLYGGKYKLDFWPFKILEKITDNSDYLGHIEGSPYFWGDVARDAIKYMRLPFHSISETNTLKVNPSMPFHDPKRPYVNYWFSSSDGSEINRFNKLLTDSNIQRLKKENGVCLIYTHFAKGFVEKKSGRHVLNDEFVKTITNLSKYPNGWFPTATELLDRLLACKFVSVNQHGNVVRIQNSGSSDLNGLILKLAPDMVLTNTHSKERINQTMIIRRLPARATLSLKCNQENNALIKPCEATTISRSERIKIEFYNYYGLIRTRFA